MIVLVGVLALLTGLTSKFADLLNEHGFFWHRHAGVISGWVWSLLAVALTLTDPWVAAMWWATCLFWFFRCKLDHFNHALAGVGVVVAATLFAVRDEFPFGPAVGVLIWLSVTSVVQNAARRRWPHNEALVGFLRLRLRFYAGPVALAVIGDTWLPVVAIVFGMLGTEIVTIWHGRVAASGRARNWRTGLSYLPAADTGDFRTPVAPLAPRPQVVVAAERTAV